MSAVVRVRRLMSNDKPAYGCLEGQATENYIEGIIIININRVDWRAGQVRWGTMSRV